MDFFLGFVEFFWDFLRFSRIFKILGFSGYFRIFSVFLCVRFLDFFSKLLRLLLKINEVTTEHQKWHKVSKNSIKSSFFARRAKMPRTEAKALCRS